MPQRLTNFGSGALERDELSLERLLIPFVPAEAGTLVELSCRHHDEFPRFVLISSTARSDHVRSRLRRADRVLHKPDTFNQLEVMLSNAIATI
jgi:hypothetical protein